MSEIVVNFQALRTAGDDIGTTVSNMNGQLEGLKSGLQPMISTWDGEAQAQYLVRQAEWESAAQDLNMLLGMIQKAVYSAADTMEAREKKNAARFGG